MGLIELRCGLPKLKERIVAYDKHLKKQLCLK